MDPIGALLAKLVGALCGAVLAIVFIWPTSLREAASRAVVSVLTGALAEPVVRWYWSMPPDDELRIGAAAGAAFISWWALGLGIAIVDYLRKQRSPGS